MLIPTLVMGLIALLCTWLAFRHSPTAPIFGFKAALQMTLNILPLLLFAFIIAGMIQAILPKDMLTKWIGLESGIKGILIGSLVGGLAPGVPYVSLPIAAGLLRSGAGIGTMVAFLTGWSLWAVSRIPMEVGVMGWKFTLIRIVSTLFFPPLAGIIAHIFFANSRL